MKNQKRVDDVCLFLHSISLYRIHTQLCITHDDVALNIARREIICQLFQQLKKLFRDRYGIVMCELKKWSILNYSFSEIWIKVVWAPQTIYVNEPFYCEWCSIASSISIRQLKFDTITFCHIYCQRSPIL